jgi:hypothetical protein
MAAEIKTGNSRLDEYFIELMAEGNNFVKQLQSDIFSRESMSSSTSVSREKTLLAEIRVVLSDWLTELQAKLSELELIHTARNVLNLQMKKNAIKVGILESEVLGKNSASAKANLIKLEDEEDIVLAEAARAKQRQDKLQEVELGRLLKQSEELASLMQSEESASKQRQLAEMMRQKQSKLAELEKRKAKVQTDAKLREEKELLLERIIMNGSADLPGVPSQIVEAIVKEYGITKAHWSVEPSKRRAMLQALKLGQRVLSFAAESNLVVAPSAGAATAPVSVLSAGEVIVDEKEVKEAANHDATISKMMSEMEALQASMAAESNLESKRQSELVIAQKKAKLAEIERLRAEKKSKAAQQAVDQLAKVEKSMEEEFEADKVLLEHVFKKGDPQVCLSWFSFLMPHRHIVFSLFHLRSKIDGVRVYSWFCANTGLIHLILLHSPREVKKTMKHGSNACSTLVGVRLRQSKHNVLLQWGNPLFLSSKRMLSRSKHSQALSRSFAIWKLNSR